MKKKILIPGGKLSDWALVNAAHKLGMYVITSGTDNAAPAHEFSDKYICADYSDKEAMLKIAKEEKIDYMCSCANDFGMISTSYVCEQLGLPGHDSFETTCILHRKDTLKALSAKLGLHMPVSVSFSDRSAAISYLEKSNGKQIVKPVDNVDSRGVSTVDCAEDIAGSVDNAFANSRIKKIIIEPFITCAGGTTYCTCDAMLVDKKVRALVCDALLTYKEGKIEGGGQPEFPVYRKCNGVLRPAPYLNEFAPVVTEDFNKLANELNLVDGPVHCELLLDDDHQPHIFDFHRRMSGMPEPWVNWKFTIDADWVKYLVMAECGMDISDFPEGLIQNKFLHTRNIYAPKNGILKKMEFDEYLSSHIYPKFFEDGSKFAIYDRFVTDCTGYPIIKCMPPNVNGRLHFRFDTHEEACSVGSVEEDNFYKHITFEYEEDSK